MSFRKLLLEFSITKEIVLISYQAWVRSYLKHSGRLIKHGQPEVITLFFLCPCCPLGLFSSCHEVWHAPKGVFDAKRLIFSDKQGKRKREKDIFLCHFAFWASYFTALRCPRNHDCFLRPPITPLITSLSLFVFFSPPLTFSSPRPCSLDGDCFEFAQSLSLQIRLVG